jgi:hypothetical protein
MPERALRELLTLAGLGAAEAVAFSGADPVLPTPYRIATAGAASIAASGIAAAHLAELRGGARQQVAVDLRAAAAALRSARYLAIDGVPRSTVSRHPRRGMRSAVFIPRATAASSTSTATSPTTVRPPLPCSALSPNAKP